MKGRPYLIALFAVLAAGSLAAQQPDDKAKSRSAEKGILVEQVLGEIPNLRLAENRAGALARTGVLVCKSDPKLAAEIFRSSVSDLLSAQSFAEADRKNPGPNQDLLNSQVTRPMILRMIAGCDAEFALQSLYKSRPTAVERAFAIPADAPPKLNNISPAYSTLAQNEINLEQLFMRLAAEQNPDSTIDLLKASLKKGLSAETLSLLKRLNSKDPVAAAEMADEVIGRLMQTGFLSGNQPDRQAISLAGAILAEFARNKTPTETPIKFDPARVHSLLDRLVSFYVVNGKKYGYSSFRNILPAADKLSPSAARQLRSLEATSRPTVPGSQDSEFSKLLSTNPNADTLLAYARRASETNQRQAYFAAANKLADAGEYDRALAILNNTFSDETLENAIGSLNWYYVHLLMNKGRYSEAEQLIEQFGDNNRRAATVELAKALFRKDPVGNKNYAVTLLDKVRAELPARPETNFEMQQLVQLIVVYLDIEQSEGLRMFEPLIPLINDLSDASAMMWTFQGMLYVKQGEFMINQGFPYNLNLDPTIFRTMSQKDFDSTLKLVDGFNRREMRIWMKINLAEAR
ncbi:MAG: hypothetical protein ABI539_07435 [Acidobacteriota bacterium]